MLPWFKKYHTSHGLDLFTGSQLPDGLGFDFNSYLLTNSPKHAAELYEEKLQNYLARHHPGQTLQTILYKQTVKKYQPSILPPVLPLEIGLPGWSVNTFAEVSEDDRISITLDFKKYDGDDNYDNDPSLLTYTAIMPEISGKRICLEFKNVSGILKPVIKVDGLIVKGGETTYPGLEPSEKFYISYIGGGGYTDQVHRPPMDAGTFIHIGLDPLAVSSETIAILKKEYANLDKALMDAPGTREQLLGRMGKIISDTFLLRSFQTATRIDNQLHIRGVWNNLAPTFIFTEPTNIKSDMESKFWFHPQWNIDARTSKKFFKRRGDRLEPLEWNHPVSKLARLLLGYAVSYNEGMIFEDWQDTPGLSTIKGLMIANEDPDITVATMTDSDIGMLENMKSDYDPVDNALLPPAVLDLMIQMLDKGSQITAPLKIVTYKDMSAFVMLANSSIGDSYLFNMFNGGAASEFIDPLDSILLSYFDTPLDPISLGPVKEIYCNANDGATVPQNISLGALPSWVGDPVNMATGEFYHEAAPDIIIPLRGAGNLVVARTYKSQLIYNGLFGYGWAWNHG